MDGEIWIMARKHDCKWKLIQPETFMRNETIKRIYGCPICQKRRVEIWEMTSMHITGENGKRWEDTEDAE